MRSRFRLLPLIVVCLIASVAGQSPRLLTVDDLFELANVGDPQISPDGEWIAYTVSRLNREDDNSDTDIYMVSFETGESIRMTSSPKGESRPRWSPDGRWLAFVSGRDEGKKAQVWLLDRRGGEAQRLTEFKGGVGAYAWSPDSTRLAVISRDPDPDEDKEKKTAADKAPRPIEVRRLQFKRDGAGYLNDRRNHLHVFDIESRESFQLTSGPHDHSSPVWAPDGDSIVFVSNRTEEPDANANTDLFLIAAREGAEPVRLTSSESSDSQPSFSPDGRSLAYIRGGDPADIWYATNNLALLRRSASGDWGAPRLLSPGLDRNLGSPRFGPDGRDVYALLEDRGTRQLVAFPVEGGAHRPVVAGERTVSSFTMSKEGRLAVLESTVRYPNEISAARDGALRRLTRVNDEFLAGIELASVEWRQSRSADGTEIDFFLTRPPRTSQSPLPTLLRIHGGPVSQFSFRFSFEWQLFAAHGYAVVAANPRGSSGRGRDFSRAIWADWGVKDFSDVMGAVDEAIRIGVADADRLGVGGWSYGGILTNYVITKTGRFKAAISGASEVNYTANYGHDHYQRQWEAELGLPWENTDDWIRISPFFSVDRVTTPTLIMCGQVDWNVPLQNSDQLYQALRRLGVETELIVYPGQSHGIRRPSYQVDRYERYLAWYDRFLKPQETSTGAQ